MVLKSIINSEELFIPFAGMNMGTAENIYYGVGSYFSLWTSDAKNNDSMYTYKYDNLAYKYDKITNIIIEGEAFKFRELPIRPVLNIK